MQLIELTVHNFKIFKGTHTIQLKQLNLFQGENGEGKSCLIIDAILFVLHGYAKQTIEQLITKGEKECYVHIILKQNNKTYSIKRSIPSKLKILEDAVPIEGSLKVKKEFLNGVFHDIEWFRKFRLFDSVEGINILESSSLSLRKNILSFNENKLNAIRQKLLKLKSEREIYNKNNIKMSPHYPSNKRKNILQQVTTVIKNKINQLQQKMNKEQQEINSLNYKLGSLEQNNKGLGQKINNVTKLVICPVCHQEVTNKYKEEVKEEVCDLINKNLDVIVKLENSLDNKILVNKELKNKENKYNKKILKAQDLLNKLNQRLQQTKYVWTNKDLAVVKQSIVELDSFHSFYLTESIKNLEPLINHILNKVNYHIHFKLDKKHNFNFIIKFNNQEFEYKELSTGQRLIVSMAFKMALLLDRGESGLIISDEGMSSLSEVNLELMFNIISSFPFQLLSVVHRYENPANFLNLFEIKRGSVKWLKNA